MVTQPVWSISSIVAAVAAAIALLVAFGVPISDDQKIAILGAFGVIAPLITAAFANPQVTPLAEPKTVDGERLVRASGDPTPPQTRSAARK